MKTINLQFADNPSLKGREDRYVITKVRTEAILKSWRQSLFSFEWLTPGGNIRPLDDLPLHERDKRVKVEKSLTDGTGLTRPVLGIGMMGNVEIGAGRDVFLTLAAHGLSEIEVHIPASCKPDFKQFTTA